VTTIDRDDDLELLELRVQHKLHGRIASFQLNWHHKGIVLRGFARTYYAKQLAQHVVMTETDIQIAANEIQVQ
jgi:hypothetical protein